MLRLGAESGYDVKRAVDISTRFFWTISEAQIYPMLHTLEDSGLIEGRDASQGRRKRRAYVLTPEGERTLVQWLSSPAPDSFEVRDVAMLKIFFADAGSDDDAVELLARFRARSEETLERLYAQQGPSSELAESGAGKYPELALRIGIAVHRAMADVAGEIAEEIGQPEAPSAPG
jgi:DNA-binding PadR family transcriptional regulator